MPSIGDVMPATRARRVLPVVAWLQTGAVAGALGLALAAAPAAAADDNGSTVSSRSNDSAQSPAVHRRAAQTRPAGAAAADPAESQVRARRSMSGSATAAPTANLTAGVPNLLGALPGRLPAGKFQDLLAGSLLLARRNGLGTNVTAPSEAVTTTSLTAPISNAAADASIRLAIFGDAGNSYANGTSFYYAPGTYRRSELGATGPMQQAVAEMMRSWNPSDVVQLGDESYNVASSTLLDYNIGQYYNNWIAPYAPPAYTQPGSIYTDAAQGGVQAVPGKTQWPYNIYNFPNGFPNPADPTKPGGSPDGVNHYWAVPGNHDEGTILSSSYYDASVNQVKKGREYIGKPIGPDAYDYKNNITSTNPNYQPDPVTGKISEKTGSTQGLLDYHAYLGEGNPGNLKPGTLNVGSRNPDGYGIYYSVNLGDAGDGRPLIHLTIIDTSRLLTDAGYYDFNFAPNSNNKTRDPKNGEPTDNRYKLLNYDVRDPNTTASQAWFQPKDVADSTTEPSIGRKMFLWAKEDLENSDAVWNIVMGHEPAYHAGSPRSADDGTYTSNAPVLNLLQGLKDDTGAPLFDAYMNGHSHAYARVLEMSQSASGIGTGIPFFTIGNGGKTLDSLNLAPYGTSVITPENYFNVIGGVNNDGSARQNIDINGYLKPIGPGQITEKQSLAPYLLASPTSVGLSGWYQYSQVNWPEFIPDPNNPDKTGYQPLKTPAEASVTVTSVTKDIGTNSYKQFKLNQPAYRLDPSQSDLSGLYGFGSGAAQLDAGDSYMMMHYKTAQPIDPAIALIGRSQGVTSFDPSSLFYKQWSPNTAKWQDLGMFSFDVNGNGSVTNVQLVNRGNGYFESDLTASSYLDTTQRFEILGNNPTNPLGFNNSDPTRAVVELSFSGGELTGATLVNPGSGYQQVTNAIMQTNEPTPNGTVSGKAGDNNSLLVGINIDLQGQYTLAASRPTGTDSYHDWYMMTDTGVGSGSTSAAGDFGAVDLALQPRSQTARQLITDTPLTTGYTGLGTQQKYLAPQTGTLTLVDSLGQEVGTAAVVGGNAKVTLNQLAAPGPLWVKFSGDSTSSYQVNYRSIGLNDNVQVGLNYGTWTGPVIQQGSQLQLAKAETVQVIRTDTGEGLVTFGLGNGSSSEVLVRLAVGAQPGALQADDLFVIDPAQSWQSTEHRSVGGAGSARVGAGNWTPTARLNGRDLTLVDLRVTSNGALARFAAGNPGDPSDDVLATFTLPSTGKTTTAQNGVLTVRRLSSRADGLALYEADPVTGAVVDSKGRTFKPGQIGYLKAALDNAKQLGLVLTPQDMPGFGETVERTDLPLELNRNYGTLLMVNGSERNMLSSYSNANILGSIQALSLIAPDRGVSYGFEDKRPWEWGADRDFNDVIVTLTPAAPTLTMT